MEYFCTGARAGKHTDKFLEKLSVITEGKTDCKQWSWDDLMT